MESEDLQSSHKNQATSPLSETSPDPATRFKNNLGPYIAKF